MAPSVVEGLRKTVLREGEHWLKDASGRVVFAEAGRRLLLAEVAPKKEGAPDGGDDATELVEAEEPEDLYEVAKALWTAIGKAPFRPAAKSAAKIFAKWYPPLHKAFFDVEKNLGGEAEEGEQEDDGDGEEAGDETDGAEGAAEAV